jgi:hypothetical protein
VERGELQSRCAAELLWLPCAARESVPYGEWQVSGRGYYPVEAGHHVRLSPSALPLCQAAPLRGSPHPLLDWPRKPRLRSQRRTKYQSVCHRQHKTSD